MYTKMNLRGVSTVIARQKLSSLLLQHTHSLRNQHVLETKKKVKQQRSSDSSQQIQTQILKMNLHGVSTRDSS